MSTILFYESNRLSVWCGGTALPLLVLLGESNECSQAITPAVSERKTEKNREIELAAWKTMSDTPFAFTPE